MKVTFRTHSISPGDHRSSRGSGPAVPDEVLATTGLGGSARQMSASVFHPSSGRPDCVAGVVGLELRNVGANYPFEKSRRFPAIQPNLVTGDGSRLSCGVADTAILDPRLYPLVIGERVRDKIAKTQLDVRPMSWPPSAKVRARLIVIELGSEMLLRSQRKLHHAFQELVRRQADEVVHDELLGVEADEVAQLQRLAARGKDEIPVPVVDHDDVALGI